MARESGPPDPIGAETQSQAQSQPRQTQGQSQDPIQITCQMPHHVTQETSTTATASRAVSPEGERSDRPIDSHVTSGSLSEYETQPLLSSHFTNYNQSDASFTTSKYSQLITDKIVKFSKRRFWWFCALGIVAIIILNLSFLPRTSLSRDYRRYHGLHLTKNDVKRSYLLYSGVKSFEQFSNEQHIDWALGNLSSLNQNHPVNLLHQDNPELTDFIFQKFEKFGFKPESVKFNTHLQAPISSYVRLVDGEDVVYDGNLMEKGSETPSYYGSGFNGSCNGGYIYANEGTDDDYETLLNNLFVVKDKIVIIKSVPDSKLSVLDKILVAEKYKAKGVIHYIDYGDSDLKDVISRDSLGKIGSNRTQIPCLPISMKAVKPILETLNKSFLDWEYYPEQSKFSLEVSSLFGNEKKRESTVVIGSLNGIIKDGDIVVGASRDSLTSSSPLSNQAILLEIMRHFDKLVRLGWRPLRNIKFVSFDGTANGLLGSQHLADSDYFKAKILAFINIDADAVTGSDFVVESNPLLDHVIKKVSKEIPFPRDNVPFTKLDETEDENDDSDDSDDDDDDFTSLHRYWKIQNNNTIHQHLGNIATSDSAVFQYHMGVPVMNVKFQNNGARDATYTPNSNYYSYKWIESQNIDPKRVLHGLLIRYIGLLLISMAEHEVVDFRTKDYFKFAQLQLEQIFETYDEQLDAWGDEDVSSYFLGRFNTKIKFKDLMKEFKNVIKDIGQLSIIFDQYNGEVQDGLTRDYAWYFLFRKLKLWAQFKVSNYKLLHIETGLSTQDGWFKHLIYDGVGGLVFDKLRRSIEERDLKEVALLVNKYKDTFDGFNRKLS